MKKTSEQRLEQFIKAHKLNKQEQERIKSIINQSIIEAFSLAPLLNKQSDRCERTGSYKK